MQGQSTDTQRSGLITYSEVISRRNAQRMTSPTTLAIRPPSQHAPITRATSTQPILRTASVSKQSFTSSQGTSVGAKQPSISPYENHHPIIKQHGPTHALSNTSIYVPPSTASSPSLQHASKQTASTNVQTAGLQYVSPQHASPHNTQPFTQNMLHGSPSFLAAQYPSSQPAMRPATVASSPVFATHRSVPNSPSYIPGPYLYHSPNHLRIQHQPRALVSSPMQIYAPSAVGHTPSSSFSKTNYIISPKPYLFPYHSDLEKSKPQLRSMASVASTVIPSSEPASDIRATCTSAHNEAALSASQLLSPSNTRSLSVQIEDGMLSDSDQKSRNVGDRQSRTSPRQRSPKTSSDSKSPSISETFPADKGTRSASRNIALQIASVTLLNETASVEAEDLSKSVSAHPALEDDLLHNTSHSLRTEKQNPAPLQAHHIHALTSTNIHNDIREEESLTRDSNQAASRATNGTQHNQLGPSIIKNHGSNTEPLEKIISKVNEIFSQGSADRIEKLGWSDGEDESSSDSQHTVTNQADHDHEKQKESGPTQTDAQVDDINPKEQVSGNIPPSMKHLYMTQTFRFPDTPDIVESSEVNIGTEQGRLSSETKESEVRKEAEKDSFKEVGDGSNVAQRVLKRPASTPAFELPQHASENEDESPEEQLIGPEDTKNDLPRNQSSMVDSLTAVVIDLGEGSMKVGMAGTRKPTCVIPTVLGTPKRLRTSMVDEDEDSCYIGEKALSHPYPLQLIYPIQSGKIVSRDALDQILNHVFSVDLRVDPTDRPVCVAISPNLSPTDQLWLTEALFENYGVPGIYFVHTPVASMHSCGILTGVVIESGYQCTSVIPVYQGHCVPHAIQTLPLGGKHITERLKKLLVQKCASIGNTSKDMFAIEEAKQKYAYVSANYKAECANATPNGRQYTLPDKQTVTLGSERFQATEILFQPSLADVDSLGLIEMIQKCISSVDVDMHRDLWRQIVISGGNTMLSGFSVRLKSELARIAPRGAHPMIVEKPERGLMAYRGASITAGLPSHKGAFLTREQYLEMGSKAIFRKFF
eukprot:TRINITY_DN7738_c0_g2_i1.p1 TRINITY_DN7738_c0_g2~~TRINITY_DN7738_c0_g2_i1.p1  ORF type:complete len:1045 (-),score=206.12 TRINITY_DN7738_c0_g2_i1:269-3403(-)